MARNFNELRDKMSPERRARVDERAKKTIERLRAQYQKESQSDPTEPPPNRKPVAAPHP